MKQFLNIFVAACLGGATVWGIGHMADQKKEFNSNDINNPHPVKLVNMSTVRPENGVDFTNAADASIHAVVHVKTVYEGNDQAEMYGFDPFHLFGEGPYRMNPNVPRMGSGSGVIISKDGYIVTNNHVIDKADKIEVALNDKRTYTAELIGRDPATDLALLKIKEKDLPYLGYGNSDQVKVGEWVLAVGNPFNLTSTVTAGIVSAKGRNINILENDPAHGVFPVESFIQTDAAVNPGNSGGALVNTQGDLVGINAAIASQTGSYSGYSFAIPVNIVKKVVADLLEFGEVQRAFIGVNIKDLDAKLAEEKGISDLKGVYVAGVADGGSAKDAGMQEGDVISKVNDIAVNNVPELQEQISRYRPGDKVNITVKRGNVEKSFSIALKNKSGSTELVKREVSSVEAVKSLGASFEQVSKEEMKKLGIRNGLKIVSLSGGKLRNSGMHDGFIITHIDKKPIHTTGDIEKALNNKEGGVLIEGLYPNGMQACYGFRL